MKAFAALFPGQGAQFPGMGRELHRQIDCSRAVFDEADATLESPISEICFDGTAEQLALTENTQPAILTVSVAALRALAERGLKPVACAGHSLGEYSAHVASGTLEFAEAVRTVRYRGRYMQDAVPVGTGAMAAILGLDAAALEEVCREAGKGEVVSPANLNSPGQIVIAGHAGAVDRAAALAREAGARRAVMLPVSAPFHCSLMQPAAARLGDRLQGVPFSDSDIPVYTNVDAAIVRGGEPARDALVRQVASPVRWHESMQAMLADGIDTFVEIGPGNVLAGLMRKIRRDATVISVGDPDGVDRAVRELGEAA